MSIEDIRAAMKKTEGEMNAQMATLEGERENINRKISQLRRDIRTLKRVARNAGVDLDAEPEKDNGEDITSE